ncbi:hypothetical protein Gotur_015766 [Gossypium turneri]
MPRRRLRDLSVIQNPPNSKETNSDQKTAIGSSNVPNTIDKPEKFALEVSDNYMKKALGKKWRDHKSTLKKEYFKKNISLEEKLRNVPPGILRYQWEDAVSFWNSKKGEQQQKFTHTARSKSFACVADDEELSSGQKVGRIQLFDITHRKKDGSPMITEAVEIMEKLKDKMAEYEAIASSDSSVNLDGIDNRIITKVLGPERLRDQMAQMQTSTVEQITQLKVEAASREVEATRKYDELQLQHQNMMKMFQQNQS